MKKPAIVIVSISLIAVFSFLVYLESRSDQIEVPGWKTENRIILQEFYSPDSSVKIGVYYYDLGGLGYSTMNLSVTSKDAEYPIEANLFTSDRTVLSVDWLKEDEVLISLPDNFGASTGRTTLPERIQTSIAVVRTKTVPNTGNAPP